MSAKKGQRRWGHIRKLESGRFQASFIGPDLRRYNGPRPFDSKMLAEGWLAREREMIMMSDYGRAALGFPGRTQNQGGCARRNRGVLREALDRGPQPRTPHAKALRRSAGDFTSRLPLAKSESAHCRVTTVNHWHAKTLTDKPTARAHAYGLLHAICASAVEARTTDQEPVSDQTGDEHESQTGTGPAFGYRTGSRCRRDATGTIQGAGLAIGLGRTAIR